MSYMFIELGLTPKTKDQLDDLKRKTNAEHVDIIANALKMYDGIITEVEKGSQFLTCDKDGKITPYKMFQ